MMKTRRDFVRDASKGVLAASVAPALALGDVLAATQTGTGLVSDPRYLEHRLPGVASRIRSVRSGSYGSLRRSGRAASTASSHPCHYSPTPCRSFARFTRATTSSRSAGSR